MSQRHQNSRRNNRDNSNTGAIGAVGEKLIKEMVAKMSIENLDDMARSGDTALGTGLFSATFECPPDKGHWKFRLVPSSTGWDHRSLVLMPDDSRTRGIWTEGQIKFAQKHGLTNPQARIWARSSVARRHELIHILGPVMQNEAKRNAYLEYGEGIKDEKNFDYHAWSSKHGIKDGLSVTARKLLVEQIKELINTSDERQNARHPGGNGIAVNPLMAKLFESKKEEENQKRQASGNQGTNKDTFQITREPLSASGGLLPAHTPPAQEVQVTDAAAPAPSMEETPVIADVETVAAAPAAASETVVEESPAEPVVVAEAAPQISNYDDEDIGATTPAAGSEAISGDLVEEAPAVAASAVEGVAEADVDIR